MDFYLYTFGSDYLKEKFIAMESCSLLSSKLPSTTPKIFFTRDLQKDYDCEILVIETLKKDLRAYVRTQKHAKTVLITSTPFTSLDAFLSLGIECSFVCMNKGDVVFSTEEPSFDEEEECELQRFSNKFNIERSYELDKFSSLLDVGMLKKKLWLVSAIRSNIKNDENGDFPGNLIDNDRSSSPNPHAFTLVSDGSIQYDNQRINPLFSHCYDEYEPYDLRFDALEDDSEYENADINSGRRTAPLLSSPNPGFGSFGLGCRFVFKSSNGEPSELRSLRNMRPRFINNQRKRINQRINLLGEEAESTESAIPIGQSFLGSNNNSYVCIFNDDYMFRIRGVYLNAASNNSILHGSQRKRRRSRRKNKVETEFDDHLL